MPCLRVVFCGVAFFSFVGIPSPPVLGKPVSDALIIRQNEQCGTAQACFESRNLSDVVARFSGSVWAARARFLIGTQLIENGDSAGRSSLEHLPDKLPLVADYVQWYLAKSFFIDNNFQKAALAYQSIGQRFPDSLLVHQAQYFEGVSWFRFGDCESAEKPLTVVFVGRPGAKVAEAGLRPASGFYLADCYLKRGNRADAAKILWHVWTDMPHLLREADTLHALTAFGDFDISSEYATAEQLWRRAIVFFDAGEYSKAVDAFATYRHVVEAHHHVYAVDGQIKLGIALMKTRRLNEARTVFENVIHQAPSDVTPEVYLWLARTYLRLGSGEGLELLSQQMTTLSLPPSIHVSILYFLGLWHEDQQSVGKARGAYQRAMDVVVDDYAGVWTHGVLWQLAWTYFRGGDYIQAIQVFDRMIQNPTGNNAQRSLYWKAIALERLGKAQDSRVAFLDVCEDFPHGYYCQNTCLHLGMPPSGKMRLPESRVVAMTDPSLDRVKEMILLGLTDDAMTILHTVWEEDTPAPQEFLAIGQQLKANGDTYQSLRLMKQQFGNVIRGGHISVPSWFWELVYPETYMSMILDAIAEDQASSKIDPYVIAALIREESAFDMNARSEAGAVGLMQIIPQTGYQIARFRHMNLFDSSMLFDPYLNIQFGVWYFRSLLRQFDGNLISSIAGYNAGPVVVERWRKEAEEMLWDREDHVSHEEEFIETIPYEETRNYVKRVLQTYREYHRVIGTDCRLRFLDKQC